MLAKLDLLIQRGLNLFKAILPAPKVPFDLPSLAISDDALRY
jgi:hypothetical protein